jgi:hypothetical protein
MPLLGSPDPLESTVGCDVVYVRRVLGLLIDANFTMAPGLADVLAKGKTVFDHFFDAAESGGFSIPVLAAQVLVRVELVVMHGCELLVLAKGA